MNGLRSVCCFLGFLFLPLFVYSEDIGLLTVLVGRDHKYPFTLIRKHDAVHMGSKKVKIQHGDIIEPASGVILLYSPNNISCEAIRFSEKRSFSKCDASPSLRNWIYNLARDVIMENRMMVPVQITRGDGTRVMVHRDSPELQASSFIGWGDPLRILFDSDRIRLLTRTVLGNMPNIEFTDDEVDADITITVKRGNKAVLTDRVASASGRITELSLPDESDELRRKIWTAMLSKAVIRSLSSGRDGGVFFRQEYDGTLFLGNPGPEAVYCHVFVYDDSAAMVQVFPEYAGDSQILNPGQTVTIHLPPEQTHPRGAARLFVSDRPLWFGVPAVRTDPEYPQSNLDMLPLRSVSPDWWYGKTIPLFTGRGAEK